MTKMLKSSSKSKNGIDQALKCVLMVESPQAIVTLIECVSTYLWLNVHTKLTHDLVQTVSVVESLQNNMYRYRTGRD